MLQMHTVAKYYVHTNFLYKKVHIEYIYIYMMSVTTLKTIHGNRIKFALFITFLELP